MRASFWIGEQIKRRIIPSAPGWPTGGLRRFVTCGLIGLLALSLAACTALRLTYGQGPRIVYWWVDDYADFNRDQAPRVKAAIERWFDWHRQTQLPLYTRLLEQASRQAEGEITADQVCAWWDQGLSRRDAALLAMAPAVAEIAPTLTTRQLDRIAAEFEHSQAKWRDKYAQPDPREREEEAIDRAIEQAEKLYGRLSREQRLWMATQVRAAPWDADRALAEREAHHQDTLRSLRQMGQPGLTPAQRLAQAQAWLGRLQDPTNSAFADLLERSVQHWCRAGAELHHRASATQRERAARTLRGWQADLASFIAPTTTPTAALTTP